ncbi:MAG: hypothetical protein ACC628_09495 [Pirellulaceae bacterium]
MASGRLFTPGLPYDLFADNPQRFRQGVTEVIAKEGEHPQLGGIDKQQLAHRSRFAGWSPGNLGTAPTQWKGGRPMKQPVDMFTMLRLLILLLACAPAAARAEEPDQPRRIIRLPWHIYRHFPADFSRWDEAAAGFRGWEAEQRELDLDRCCLVLMHLPSQGLTPTMEWGPDSQNPNALGTVEWVPRTMNLVALRLPRLVKAAREAGLLVVHVGGAPGTGPVWEKSLKEAGDPPPPDPDCIARDEGRWAQHTRDVFDLPRTMFGYIFELHELTTALRKLPSGP